MSQDSPNLGNAVPRRNFVLGASLAGASAVAAVAVVSLTPSQAAVTAATQATPDAPEKGGGYHLSAHVKRYYQTTTV